MAQVALHEVRLLGRPAIRVGDAGWSDLEPGLTSALLGYLAFQNRWVEAGESLEITRRGVRIGRVVPTGAPVEDRVGAMAAP
jgi:hypothetical protein